MVRKVINCTYNGVPAQFTPSECFAVNNNVKLSLTPINGPNMRVPAGPVNLNDPALILDTLNKQRVKSSIKVILAKKNEKNKTIRRNKGKK